MSARVCLLQRVREKALEDVVVLNADSNTLETPFDDVQALPPDVVSTNSSHLLLPSQDGASNPCPSQGLSCAARCPC